MIFHGWCVDCHLISVGSKRDETSIDLVYGSSYLCVYRFFGRMKNDEHSFFLLWYILMLTEADQGELTKRGASVSHDLCAGGHRWILLMLSSSSKSLRPSLHHPWVEQSHSPRFLIFLVKALDLTSTRPWHAEPPISWNHEIMKIMKIMIGVQKCQKVD